MINTLPPQLTLASEAAADLDLVSYDGNGQFYRIAHHGDQRSVGRWSKPVSVTVGG